MDDNLTKRCSLGLVPTCPLWCKEVEVLDVLPEGLDILVDGVRRHAAYLYQSVVLDEDCVAGQVTVDYWLLDRNVKFQQSVSVSHSDLETVKIFES